MSFLSLNLSFSTLWVNVSFKNKVEILSVLDIFVDLMKNFSLVLRKELFLEIVEQL